MKKGKPVVFASIMVWVSGLLACSSGVGVTVPQDGPGSLEGNLDFVDDVQKTQEESENVPTKEDEEEKNFGALDDVPESVVEEQQEEGQETQEEEQKHQEKKPQEEQFQTWQSAYLEVIYHLWDYLAPRYEPRTYEDTRKKWNDPMNLSSFWLGLHDFDGDGILELITGDGWGLAVFTYENGNVRKIVDLCDPDLSAVWCVNGVYFKENSICAACAGSGGVNVVNFGYIEGEYVLGHYNEQTPTNPVTINGKEATKEEVEEIYPNKLEEGERKERLWLVNENGTWIIKHYESDEESVLDMDFDFDSVLW